MNMSKPFNTIHTILYSLRKQSMQMTKTTVNTRCDADRICINHSTDHENVSVTECYVRTKCVLSVLINYISVFNAFKDNVYLVKFSIIYHEIHFLLLGGFFKKRFSFTFAQMFFIFFFIFFFFCTVKSRSFTSKSFKSSKLWWMKQWLKCNISSRCLAYYQIWYIHLCLSKLYKNNILWFEGKTGIVCPRAQDHTDRWQSQRSCDLVPAQSLSQWRRIFEE